MSLIQIQEIVQVSDEDKENGHSADNLLKEYNEEFKWKSKEWKNSINVTLKLIQPNQIKSLEIKNECSAFIEVLVCKSDDETKRFQVLVSTSSFMIPSEAKSMENVNRIRTFTSEQISPHAINDKWDLVKVICTQPFNKTIPYGICYIKLYGSDDSKNEDEQTFSYNDLLNIGPFTMINNQNDNSIASGSLFAKRTRNGGRSDSESPSASPSLPKRKTQSQKETGTTITKPVKKPKTSTITKPKMLETTSSIGTTTSSIIKTSSQTSISSGRANLSSERTDLPGPSSGSSRVHSSHPSSNKRDRRTINVPFDRIMSKVVFVLSGYVNPQRSELRDKAIEMGAKYKQNWESNCTHLICAFVNTPKYREVLNKNGKIVSEKWITDCYSQQKLLSWKRYKKGDYMSPPTSEDEDDDHDEDESYQVNQTVSVQYFDVDDEDEDLIRSRMDRLEGKNNQKENKNCQNRSTNVENKSNEDKNEDSDAIYDADTDKEESDKRDSQTSQNSQLLDLFKDKYFHLHGRFEKEELRKLKRIIISFDGEIEDELSSQVNIIITNSEWNADLESACQSNDSLIVVKPKWVFDCHLHSQLVKTEPYQVKHQN